MLLPQSVTFKEVFEAVEENIKVREEALQVKITQLQVELQTLRSIFSTVDKLVDLNALDLMKKAAAKAGLPFEAWVIETLSDAILQHSDIRIDDTLYMRLQSLAEGRHFTIDRITTGKAFTDLIRDALDNRHI